MGIFDPWAGFGITLHTIFRKTFTQGYPQKGRKKVTLSRFHSRHQLNSEQQRFNTKLIMQ